MLWHITRHTVVELIQVLQHMILILKGQVASEYIPMIHIQYYTIICSCRVYLYHPTSPNSPSKWPRLHQFHCCCKAWPGMLVHQPLSTFWWLKIWSWNDQCGRIDRIDVSPLFPKTKHARTGSFFGTNLDHDSNSIVFFWNAGESSGRKHLWNDWAKFGATKPNVLNSSDLPAANMNNTSQVAVHWVMGITAGTLEVKGNQILIDHLTPSLFHIDEMIKTNKESTMWSSSTLLSRNANKPTKNLSLSFYLMHLSNSISPSFITGRQKPTFYHWDRSPPIACSCGMLSC